MNTSTTDNTNQPQYENIDQDGENVVDEEENNLEETGLDIGRLIEDDMDVDMLLPLEPDVLRSVNQLVGEKIDAAVSSRTGDGTALPLASVVENALTPHERQVVDSYNRDPMLVINENNHNYENIEDAVNILQRPVSDGKEARQAVHKQINPSNEEYAFESIVSGQVCNAGSSSMHAEQAFRHQNTEARSPHEITSSASPDDDVDLAMLACINRFSDMIDRTVHGSDSSAAPGTAAASSSTHTQQSLNQDITRAYLPSLGPLTNGSPSVPDLTISSVANGLTEEFYKNVFVEFHISQKYKGVSCEGRGCAGAPSICTRGVDGYPLYFTRVQVRNNFHSDLRNGARMNGTKPRVEAKRVLKAGKYTFLCPSCHTLFRDEPAFRDHMVVPETGAFRCPYHCSAESSSAKQLWLHMIRTHTSHKRAILSGEFKCVSDGCQRSFTSAAGLKVHVKKAHDDGTRACRICKITLPNRAALEAHNLVVHQLEAGQQLPHACDVERCTARFASLRGLHRHKVLTHNM